MEPSTTTLGEAWPKIDAPSGRARITEPLFSAVSDTKVRITCYLLMSKRKLLGFELGAPPHVQIRRVFVCTSRVKELQRCENTDIAVKCYSYWRRDPTRLPYTATWAPQIHNNMSKKGFIRMVPRLACPQSVARGWLHVIGTWRGVEPSPHI